VAVRPIHVPHLKTPEAVDARTTFSRLPPLGSSLQALATRAHESHQQLELALNRIVEVARPMESTTREIRLSLEKVAATERNWLVEHSQVLNSREPHKVDDEISADLLEVARKLQMCRQRRDSAAIEIATAPSVLSDVVDALSQELGKALALLIECHDSGANLAIDLGKLSAERFVVAEFKRQLQHRSRQSRAAVQSAQNGGDEHGGGEHIDSSVLDDATTAVPGTEWSSQLDSAQQADQSS
jgi:hypothetical protein